MNPLFFNLACKVSLRFIKAIPQEFKTMSSQTEYRIGQTKHGIKVKINLTEFYTIIYNIYNKIKNEISSLKEVTETSLKQ